MQMQCNVITAMQRLFCSRCKAQLQGSRHTAVQTLHGSDNQTPHVFFDYRHGREEDASVRIREAWTRGDQFLKRRRSLRHRARRPRA